MIKNCCIKEIKVDNWRDMYYRTQVKFMFDGSELGVVSGTKIRLFSTETKKERYMKLDTKRYGSAIFAFAPCGSVVAWTKEPDLIVLQRCTPQSQRTVGRLFCDGRTIIDLLFSNCGSKIAIYARQNYEYTYAIVDLSVSGSTERKIDWIKTPGHIGDMRFTRNGTFEFVVRGDEYFRLYKHLADNLEKTFRREKSPDNYASMSSCAKTWATLTQSCCATLIKTNNCKRHVIAENVMTMTMDPYGMFCSIVQPTYRPTSFALKIVDSSNGKVIFEHVLGRGAEMKPKQMVMSRCGKHLAIVLDGRILIYSFSFCNRL